MKKECGMQLVRFLGDSADYIGIASMVQLYTGSGPRQKRFFTGENIYSLAKIERLEQIERSNNLAYDIWTHKWKDREVLTPKDAWGSCNDFDLERSLRDSAERIEAWLCRDDDWDLSVSRLYSLSCCRMSMPSRDLRLDDLSLKDWPDNFCIIRKRFKGHLMRFRADSLSTLLRYS